MLLNTKKFAFAVAIATGLAWVICSVLVLFTPSFMTNMTGHMLHMNMRGAGMMLSPTGFISGFFGWIILAGGFGWLIAVLYNFFVGESKPNA